MFPIFGAGSYLYKLLNTTDLLSVYELPRSVQLFDFSVLLTFGELDIKMATPAAGDPFLRSIFRGSSNDSLFLLFVGGRIHNSCYTT